MDKTLEIVMVAVALMVAAVIVVGLAQGQSNKYGEFADTKTKGASCGIILSQLKSAAKCETDQTAINQGRAKGLKQKYNNRCSSSSDVTDEDVCPQSSCAVQESRSACP